MNFLPMILLWTFNACFLILLGTLSIAALQALLKPKWMVPIESSLIPLTKTILPLWVLFLLVMLLRNSIFPWTSEVNLTAPFRAFYLTPGFFLVRGVIYLLAAGVFARTMRLKRSINGALSLVFVLFFGSFASYDWILSVSPHFHSTIFGLLMIITGSLVAYSITLTRLRERPQLLIDMNNVFLAMIALWTYLNLMQYITVWSGNIPEEVTYFKERFHGLSGTLAASLLIFQSFIPISLLLSKKLKDQLRFTRALAYWTLLMQSLHLLWLIGGTR